MANDIPGDGKGTLTGDPSDNNGFHEAPQFHEVNEMAKKTTDTTPEPDAYPAVLQRVRFIGGKDAPALSTFGRLSLPATPEFELELAAARALVRYWPDRYQIVIGD
ncbi:MAG: hypothetical protein IPF53_22710 [Blastocatellia bacterium]|nr:hypothetical protein [Blastocatellia bacterium]